MKLLFYTSCIMFIINGYDIILCTNPFKCICLCGITTSVLNHSLTENTFYKQFFRTLDRNAMRAGFVIYTLYQVEYLYILYLAVSFYLLSKATGKVYFHAISHFFVTIFHHKMLTLS